MAAQEQVRLPRDPADGEQTRAVGQLQVDPVVVRVEAALGQPDPPAQLPHELDQLVGRSGDRRTPDDGAVGQLEPDRLAALGVHVDHVGAVEVRLQAAELEQQGSTPLGGSPDPRPGKAGRSPGSSNSLAWPWISSQMRALPSSRASSSREPALAAVGPRASAGGPARPPPGSGWRGPAPRRSGRYPARADAGPKALGIEGHGHRRPSGPASERIGIRDVGRSRGCGRAESAPVVAAVALVAVGAAWRADGRPGGGDRGRRSQQRRAPVGPALSQLHRAAWVAATTPSSGQIEGLGHLGGAIRAVADRNERRPARPESARRRAGPPDGRHLPPSVRPRAGRTERPRPARAPGCGCPAARSRPARRSRGACPGPRPSRPPNVARADAARSGEVGPTSTGVPSLSCWQWPEHLVGGEARGVRPRRS